ncbi:MAG: alkyl hydroperoxide reductase [Flavobacteriales bacterium]|nr:alkyl hydroperoxide reductase [Flavobacteriales bacterium]|tara:strand:+ start:4345 stop:4977 length:633 start_codon:yes stop_codon:yes gene_type:complete
MSVLVGKKAPLFSSKAIIDGEKIVENFSLEQFIGKKTVVLFFYPKDFTFVCPTELFAFQEKLKDFKDRNVELIACSTDSEESHWGWLQVDKDNGGIKGITYPIIADIDKTISMNYDVLFGDYEVDENENMFATGPMIAFRALFIIDKNGIVQHQLVNHLPLGRNVDEALRMVDALHHHEENGEVCPANWEKGDEAIEESHDSVAAYLAKQ